jgi:hypothetical protein
MTDNTNPGNFANRPKEEVQNIASKGGQASHTGGFASMDPDKQVHIAISPFPLPFIFPIPFDSVHWERFLWRKKIIVDGS